MPSGSSGGQPWWLLTAHLVQVRFIVMNNVFQGALPIGKQYDLKGSTLGRTSGADAAKTGTVLKDLDLDMKLKLEEGWHDRCASLPHD